MKVSVIVLVYNVEKYIGRCLIVNNGTKDNSIEIAKKLSGKIVDLDFLIRKTVD